MNLKNTYTLKVKEGTLGYHSEYLVPGPLWHIVVGWNNQII